MKPFQTITIVCLLVALSACVGWSAEESTPVRSELFAQASQPPAEQRPMMKCLSRFDSLDANHDGSVSKSEFDAVPHPRGNADAVFARRDLNGDGTLTKEEFCSGGRGRGRGGN